ncbi:putative glyoxalase superfamily protein PhnB [Paenibacillus castaneae]|uniref:VOC family protein n=1 Tax=Paenibacillus castaneae TaxID=474957 RepID=UPI000C9AEB40|nr:VOC family protein [Paenibacillus castaneae]NIK75246.1 putative glyoxalase superfamily protein PhnB [Paenibacillus castaneae]
MSANYESKIKHFSAIFFVTDRKRVLDYYSKLGFWCDYDMGFAEREGLMMIFHESDKAAATPPNYPVHGHNAVNVYAMVEGINQLYEEFKSKGALFQYDLTTNEYQMQEFAIKDPHGYTIGFGESLV